MLGVAFDGQHVWCATGTQLRALDRSTGEMVRQIEVAATAGTAFDGRYLYQLGGDVIRKLDPETGAVVSTIPAPEGTNAGMAWAEGSLWVGRYREQKIYRIDPETGAVIRTIETNSFVTGVTFVEGELWHGAGADDGFELRGLDPGSGEVQERLPVDPVTGLASDNEGALYCGGGERATVRVVSLRKGGDR